MVRTQTNQSSCQAVGTTLRPTSEWCPSAKDQHQQVPLTPKFGWRTWTKTLWLCQMQVLNASCRQTAPHTHARTASSGPTVCITNIPSANTHLHQQMFSRQPNELPSDHDTSQLRPHPIHFFEPKADVEQRTICPSTGSWSTVVPQESEMSGHGTRDTYKS